jgi:cob(I)alamin adenosyltransferase
VYRPKSLVLGLGCDKDTPAELVERGVKSLLESAGLSLASVKEIATIDLKQDEPALAELSRKFHWPMRCYPAAELDAAPGIENPSEVVNRHVGTRAVAEPAALLAAGATRLLAAKQSYTEEGAGRSMTLAVARIPFRTREPVDAAKSGQTRGLVVIYTGHGKGKTTAALGLMLRAVGRQLPVAVVQFIKGKWKTGERLFAEGLPQVEFLVMGRGFTWDSKDLNRDKQAAAEAWEQAKAMILSGKRFAVILDEITYAINFGFIELADVLQTLRDRPAEVHVVITGRNAPQELIDCADLVSEMRNVKHPFDKGLKAQAGIDF